MTSDPRSEQPPLPPDAIEPHLTAVVQRVQQALTVQPRPDALGTAQAALLPLLQACRLDVFDLRVLRAEGLPTSQHLRYRLQLAGSGLAVDVHGVSEGLPRALSGDGDPGGPWALRTNGRSWEVRGSEGVHPFDLFDDGFPVVLSTLVGGTSPLALDARYRRAVALLDAAEASERLRRLIARVGLERVREAAQAGGLAVLMREHELLPPGEALGLERTQVQQALALDLNATQFGLVRPAPPLASIVFDDVLRHAEAVRNLRGSLEAQFDDEVVPIFSRSGLYHVLVGLALQYGREDAVPADDLIRPPDTPPDDRRSRPLGRPGWHLMLDQPPRQLETSVATLLERLRLVGRLQASQRGRPFPDLER